MSTWYGLFVTGGTPKPIVDRLSTELDRILKMPDVQARFRAVSVEPIGNSPAEMAAFIKQETQRWSDVIKKNNIAVD